MLKRLILIVDFILIGFLVGYSEEIPMVNHIFRNGNIWVEVPDGFKEVSFTAADNPEIYDVYMNDSDILIYEYNSTSGIANIEKRDLTVILQDTLYDHNKIVAYTLYKSNTENEHIYLLEKEIKNEAFRMILVTPDDNQYSKAIEIFKRCSWHNTLYFFWVGILKDCVISLLILVCFGLGGARLWNKRLSDFYFIFLLAGIPLLYYLYSESGFSNIFVLNLIICVLALFASRFKLACFLYDNFG